MFARTAATATVLVLLSAPAYAFNCPLNVKAIDAGLAKISLAAATKAEVTALRDAGNALHAAGKHKESVAKLDAAMRLILNDAM